MNNIVRNGLIAGFFSTIWLIALLFVEIDLQGGLGMIAGFAGMIVGFSFIRKAVKSKRLENGGSISFGEALKIGTLISLIATLVYVGVWELEFFVIKPETLQPFMRTYFMNHMSEQVKEVSTAAEKARIIKESTEMWINYQKVWFNSLMTATEIFPIGLLVSLIVAGFASRKKSITE